MKLSIKFLLSIALLFSILQTSYAQKKTLILKANEQAYLIFVRSGQSVKINSYLYRTIKDTVVANNKILLCVQRYDKPGGKTDFDSCFLDRATLLPVLYRASVDGGHEKFDFAKGRMKGVVTNKDSSTQIDEITGEKTYCSVAELELLELLPFKLNYTETFKLVNPGFPASDVTVKVTGEEMISLGGDAVPCWVLSSQNGNNPPNTTLWLSKSRQQFIKQSFRFKNGAIWWKVRLPDTQ